MCQVIWCIRSFCQRPKRTWRRLFFIWVPQGSCMGPLPTATNYLLCTWQELHSWYKDTSLYLPCKYTVSIICLSHFLFSVPWICFTCIQFHSVLRIIRIHIFLSDISHLFHLIRCISFLPSFRMSKQNQFQNIRPIAATADHYIHHFHNSCFLSNEKRIAQISNVPALSLSF